jgi:fructose-1,6-bisphosphatase/inositol monophosphatase family enzyme
MDDAAFAADLELAAALVRDAARLAASMRADGVEAESKSHLSDIVTAADHAAEAQIVARLRAERPDDSILGEEGAAHEGTSGRTWVIDPIDGTWNFFHGLDWWCAALALTVAADDGGDVLLGAIHHHATDSTYVGGPGAPATCNGLPLDMIPDQPLSAVAAATYLHPPFFGTAAGDAFERAVGDASTLRFLGSGSMDAVAVAQGIVGVSFQHTVPLWDRLPGEAIVRSVGGVRSEQVAGGVTWNVMGAPAAVTDVVRALALPPAAER